MIVETKDWKSNKRYSFGYVKEKKKKKERRERDREKIME